VRISLELGGSHVAELEVAIDAYVPLDRSAGARYAGGVAHRNIKESGVIMPQREFLLRPEVICDLLDRFHRSHRSFAGELDISPAYWSQVLNRHRRVTPKLRRKLLDNELIRNSQLSEDELWTINEPS